MKTLVFGASGFVGFYLKKYFNAVGTAQSGKNDNRKVNFLNENEIVEIINNEKPDLIINSAGLTNVDECERNPDLAFKLNGESVRIIARESQKVNAKFVQISTDYVFDGTKGNYKETDSPNPINVYGKSKLLGERNVLNYQDSIVLRIEMPYGINLAKNKEVFFESIINNLRVNKVVNAATDQIISPTYVEDIPKAIEVLVEKEAKGIFHLASKEHFSRYEFARMIADVFNFDKALVKEASLDKFKLVAKRPKNTFLNVGKISRFFKINTIENNLMTIKQQMSL